MEKEAEREWREEMEAWAVRAVQEERDVEGDVYMTDHCGGAITDSENPLESLHSPEGRSTWGKADQSSKRPYLAKLKMNLGDNTDEISHGEPLHWGTAWKPSPVYAALQHDGEPDFNSLAGWSREQRHQSADVDYTTSRQNHRVAERYQRYISLTTRKDGSHKCPTEGEEVGSRQPYTHSPPTRPSSSYSGLLLQQQQQVGRISSPQQQQPQRQHHRLAEQPQLQLTAGTDANHQPQCRHYQYHALDGYQCATTTIGNREEFSSVLTHPRDAEWFLNNNAFLANRAFCKQMLIKDLGGAESERRRVMKERRARWGWDEREEEAREEGRVMLNNYIFNYGNRWRLVKRAAAPKVYGKREDRMAISMSFWLWGG